MADVGTKRGDEFLSVLRKKSGKLFQVKKATVAMKSASESELSDGEQEVDDDPLP